MRGEDSRATGGEASEKERLLRAFEAFRRALFDCDVDALDALIASDYQGFDPDGQPQGRDAILSAYRPGGVRLEAYEVEGLDARVAGEAGWIAGTGRIRGAWGEHVFDHHVRFVDVYVRHGERWQLAYSQVTTLATS
ncbi:MAG: nuclear transport factor 2 family protein [Acidobacteriota bacterium]